jgi:hypothetical protein
LNSKASPDGGHGAILVASSCKRMRARCRLGELSAARVGSQSFCTHRNRQCALPLPQQFDRTGDPVQIRQQEDRLVPGQFAPVGHAGAQIAESVAAQRLGHLQCWPHVRDQPLHHRFTQFVLGRNRNPDHQNSPN